LRREHAKLNVHSGPHTPEHLNGVIADQYAPEDVDFYLQ
jgi:hypothetical protein